ncbi:hypothetical protein OROMI_027931 [Orobanche minor]
MRQRAIDAKAHLQAAEDSLQPVHDQIAAVRARSLDLVAGFAPANIIPGHVILATVHTTYFVEICRGAHAVWVRERSILRSHFVQTAFETLTVVLHIEWIDY